MEKHKLFAQNWNLKVQFGKECDCEFFGAKWMLFPLKFISVKFTNVEKKTTIFILI